MTFNDKLTSWQNGLDNAHDALLDAGGREALEREEFENRLLTDVEMFGMFAKGYIDSQDGLQSFLDWSWERRQKEVKG